MDEPRVWTVHVSLPVTQAPARKKQMISESGAGKSLASGFGS